MLHHLLISLTCNARGCGSKHKIHIDKLDHAGILNNWEDTREIVCISVHLDRGQHHIAIENLEPMKGYLRINDLYIDGYKHKVDNNGNFNI